MREYCQRCGLDSLHEGTPCDPARVAEMDKARRTAVLRKKIVDERLDHLYTVLTELGIPTEAPDDGRIVIYGHRLLDVAFAEFFRVMAKADHDVLGPAVKVG
jgi:hypothetical protein